MFPTLIRRVAETSRSQLTRGASPFKLKKVWPPDFTQLSHSDQLRFEKRYKRRLRLMGARPRWNQILRLTQLFSVTCKYHSLVSPSSGAVADLCGSRGRLRSPLHERPQGRDRAIRRCKLEPHFLSSASDIFLVPTMVLAFLWVPFRASPGRQPPASGTRFGQSPRAERVTAAHPLFT